MTLPPNAGHGASFELGAAASTSKILGKRWTVQILEKMSSGEAIRFTELKRAMTGISGTVLTERLSELELEGIISKKIYSSVPPRVEYVLTESARDLLRVLRELCMWRSRWNPGRKMEECLVHLGTS
jgi:DNA-binding HxlR family transcriptional regulator